MIEHISQQLEKRPYLVRIAGWLISLVGIIWIFFQVGCMPVSQKGLRHELGPFHERMDGQYRQTADLKAELQGEIAKVWASLGEVAKGQQTIAEWAAATNDRLVQLERAGKITQRDLGLARSAIDHLKKQMADARNASAKEHQGLKEEALVTRGVVVDEAIDTRDFVADVGRKVDDRANEIFEKVGDEAQDTRQSVAAKIQEAGEGISDQMSHNSEKIREDLKIESEETREQTERQVGRLRDDVVVHVNDLREDHKKISDAVVKERKKALQDMKQLLNIP